LSNALTLALSQRERGLILKVRQRERGLLNLELLILQTVGNMFTLVANPIFGKIHVFVGVVLVIIIG
jgi:hypothetical protein